jgi:RNA polymerase sigma factor (sigma-70 family)
MDQREERRELKRLRQGDEQAFNYFYNRYRKLVLAVLLSLIHDPEDAKDLTNDVFAAFWSQRGRLSIVFSVPSYLKRMAHNVAANFLAKKHEAIPFEEEANGTNDPDVSARMDAELLEAKLSEKEFTVLFLHDACGLSFREIAPLIGRSVDGTSGFYTRSRVKAAGILEEKTTDEGAGIAPSKTKNGGKKNE